MSTLNVLGEKLGPLSYVKSLTDVTGFGLSGHLLEICRASGVAARIQGNTLPKIAAAEAWAASYVLPDNAMRNWNAFELVILFVL